MIGSASVVAVSASVGVLLSGKGGHHIAVSPDGPGLACYSHGLLLTLCLPTWQVLLTQL